MSKNPRRLFKDAASQTDNKKLIIPRESLFNIFQLNQPELYAQIKIENQNNELI